jgi:ribosome biogenesis GTPase
MARKKLLKNTLSGLVIERYGDQLLVEPDRTIDGFEGPLVCSQRSAMIDTPVVVGDKVRFLPQVSTNSDPIGVVVDLHPRRNLLERPSGGGNIRKMKPIAANIDQVMVVIAGSPLVPLLSIDHLIVAAVEYDMDCVLVLNKVDDEASTEPFRKSIKHYEQVLGRAIVEVSVKTGAGMDQLRSCLRGKSSVFVGQSGVGKSSLVNVIVPEAATRVGSLVRRTKQIGAHTTSSSHLYHLPPPLSDGDAVKGEDGGEDGKERDASTESSNGILIDSPGIRELGLWHLSASAIKAGFTEIDEIATECKYRNCKHLPREAGCAVVKGVEEGIIHPKRFVSFHRLVDAAVK